MILSLNEIRDRARKFSKDWKNEDRERAEKDTFWNEFFNVFGITRKRVATFEQPVKKLNDKTGFIDLFWKGNLLVEHKSKGKDLEAAFEQATDYFHGLKEEELPRYVLVSDFQRFRLYDLEEDITHEFLIDDLSSKIELFGFISGYEKRNIQEQDPVNIKAAELMGALHDQLESFGYKGYYLELYLVRLLFCLFADDAEIFDKDSLKEFIEKRTKEDGSDLGALLAQIFQVLNTPENERLSNLDEQIAAFPYINGKLFEEQIPIASFDRNTRKALLDCCELDWKKISPAIFGSMFQSVMNPEERRNLGAHYTSEKNILKVIEPLFLNELKAEFERIKNNKNQLKEFHKKLGALKFLDPACGCGNFLIITYRELRLLELKVLNELHGSQQVLDIEHIMLVDVDQFYGIEYDEFPARIAEVAMWLMDHQMNLKIQAEFGMYYARLPLKNSATIIHGNALRIEWADVIQKSQLAYILGNPPFYGKQYQSKEQKEDMKLVFDTVKGAGVLDYVTAWYLKASQLIKNTEIKVGFVSTNSIVQGEQTGILWNELFNNYGIKIHFAHKTFKWSNEAKGNAGVYVVIIGFANYDIKNKQIFEYDDVKLEPYVVSVKNINPYLVEGNDLVILKRRKPICDVSEISFGSMPNDGGYLLLNDSEKDELISSEPKAAQVIKPLLSANEVLNNKTRWCIWLEGVSPALLRELKLVKQRVQKVKEIRLNSSRATTQKLAEFPTLFGEIRQPKSDFVWIPRTTSENRKYIPMALFDKDKIANDSA
jgi:type I restriction-modification system DNA methylase subunit